MIVFYLYCLKENVLIKGHIIHLEMYREIYSFLLSYIGIKRPGDYNVKKFKSFVQKLNERHHG